MELVTIMANVRGVDEEIVSNRYTYRQLIHFASSTAKEKMYVPNLIAKSLFGSASKTSGVSSMPEGRRAEPRRTGGRLPSWFSPKAKNYEVVDLDGPLSNIKQKAAEYFGGRRKQKKRR